MLCLMSFSEVDSTLLSQSLGVSACLGSTWFPLLAHAPSTDPNMESSWTTGRAGNGPPPFSSLIPHYKLSLVCRNLLSHGPLGPKKKAGLISAAMTSEKIAVKMKKTFLALWPRRSLVTKEKRMLGSVLQKHFN